MNLKDWDSAKADGMKDLIKQVEGAAIRAVKCDKCKKLHTTDAGTFFTFYGNVMIGLGGDIIGG